MKHHFLTLLWLFVFAPLFSQVGIGTTNPDPNAILEVSSSSKGLLLPRVALVATDDPAPLADNVEGMAVYNTASSGSGSNLVTPGFYVNDGNRWIRLADEIKLQPVDKTDDEWVNASGRIEIGKQSDGTTARLPKTEFVVLDNGNVGIGTDAPNALLDIGNDQRRTGLNVQGIKIDVTMGNQASITYHDPFTIKTQGANDPLRVSSDRGLLYLNAKATHPGGMYLQTSEKTRLSINATSQGDGYGGISIYDNTETEMARFAKDGKVGIGSSDPEEKLEINGAIKIANGGYSGLVDGAITPEPAGGSGTIVFSNDHFFGWNGNEWRQLDN